LTTRFICVAVWAWSYLNQNVSPWPSTTNLPVPSTNPVSGRYLVLGASPYASADDLWPDMLVPNDFASALLQPVNPNAGWTITTEIAAYIPPVYKSSAGLGPATQLQPFLSGDQIWRVAEYGSAPPVNGQAWGQPDRGVLLSHGDVGE
jgi:hypothetical protein